MPNRHPRKGRGVFSIELRPNVFITTDFDEVINRQGQFIRWMKAQPCPKRTELSSHDLKCNVCHGRGEIYRFQRKIKVIRENSPHGTKNDASCAEDILVPDKFPVCEVDRIFKFSSPEEGGVVEYRQVGEVLEGDRVRFEPIDPACPFPETWEVLQVDYSYDTYIEVEKTFTGDGSTFIFKFDFITDEMRQQLVTNPRRVRPFIAKIREVLDKDNNPIELKLRFYDQHIYLDNPLPDGQVITVKVHMQEPPIFALRPMNLKYAAEMPKYDLATSDEVMAVLPHHFEVGHGDVVTVMSSLVRSEEVLVRADLPFDALPYFDIFSAEDIVDDTGKEFHEGDDFELFDFNKILWLTDNKPAVGARYSISIFERPSFRVHPHNSELETNENKLLPKKIYLKRIERWKPGTIQAGIKKEQTEQVTVGDWSSDLGGKYG